MYKTGDLVQFLADGNIEFLGRVDQQIKIRGVRIELGEIEVIIVAHDCVAQCVVVVREDQPGDQRLAAYIVYRDDEPTITEMRGYVREHLPESMVPKYWVKLEELPLTPNGKIDRKALPKPMITPVEKEVFEPATTDSERFLVGIWTELLNLEDISVNQYFFDLGGHSLLAATMMVRVRECTGIVIPFNKLLFSSLQQLCSAHFPPGWSLGSTHSETQEDSKANRLQKITSIFNIFRNWFSHK